MNLSIIIPVFNEEKTIKEVLEKVIALKIPKVEKEIIIIDDGSKDTTARQVNKVLQKHKLEKISFFQQKTNKGKGAAVALGISHAKGEYIIIQDADLEYNPADIIRLTNTLGEKSHIAVYGTRLKRLPHFNKEESRPRFLVHYLGNKMLSLITSVLYGQWVTDMETCYKLFPKSAINGITIRARGFEFEPEITAKLIKKGIKILEIPITTKPRGYEEGKKLDTVKDGIKAVRTLLKYRFVD